MPEHVPTVERAISGPFSTTASFEDEQLELLRERCRLLFVTGLAICGIAFVVNLLIPEYKLYLESPLLRFKWATSAAAHAASFLVALGLLYLFCRRSPKYLHAIAYATMAFNIVLLTSGHVAFQPDKDPGLGVSLLLFLAAAFIPWRPSYQWALAAMAAIWFLLLQGLLQATLSEFQLFWAQRGGAEAARANVIWGVTAIAMLGGASAMVSHTLYNLKKTAHRAKRLGKYLIHGEIGEGGMGQVYFAQHSLICRPTAVKVMRPSEDGRTALARFEREIRVSATLTHPNTITIYDVGWTPERSLYYAMEYLEGLDLQQLVEKYGPLSPERVVHILKQAAGSLEEAHSRNIIHRDIKPSNIFLTRRGGIYDFVKVLDFGLAKQIKSDTASAITKTGMLFGTPRYLAPETVYGTEKIDGRADLYCLGGVAYWMLTARPVFTSETSVEVVIDHVKTIPDRPSEVSELSIPAELEDIVMRCLEKKPSDRYQTARDLESALDAVPFSDSWNRSKAEDWWNLHGIIGDGARDYDCYFPGSDFEAGEEVPLGTAEPAA
jgi:serine/threonine-protein kinase